MSGNSVPVRSAFGKIIEAFENEVWMGQLRERWKEIKILLVGGDAQRLNKGNLVTITSKTEHPSSISKVGICD